MSKSRRRTNLGLPIVSEGVCVVFDRDFHRSLQENNDYDKFYSDMFEILKKENEFLYAVAKSSYNLLLAQHSLAEATQFCAGFMDMYFLLRRQAESDQLRNDYRALPAQEKLKR